jgi:hypothetical protein
MPSIDHAFLYKSKALSELMRKFKVYCPHTQESYDIARNKILKTKSRQTKHLLLRFPKEVQLSNTHYSPKSTDGEIKNEFVSFVSKFQLDGDNYKTTVARVSWKVSIVEVEKREVQASKDTNRAAAKLAAKLASMSML